MFCPQCGNSIPSDTPFCTQCGASLKEYLPAVPSGQQAPPWPPAASPIGGSGSPSPLTPAGLGDRFLAVVLDSVLIAAAFSLAGMWAAGRWGGVTSSGFSLQGPPALIAIGATLVFGFLYYWLCEGLFGRTIGKAVLGVGVRSADGRPCTLSSSLVRNLLRLIDGIGVYLAGFLVAIFSKRRQRLGDHVAKTIVVAAPVGGAVRGTLVALWLVLWVGGLVGAYVLHRRLPQTPVTVSTGAPASGIALTGGLQFVNAAFLQAENGSPRPAAPYRPGDTVYLKYEVVGFTAGNDGKIDVILQVEARDPAGLSLYPMWEKELIQAVPPGEPVRGSFNIDLPAFAPPGVYAVHMKARDKIKGTEAALSPTFQTEAPPVAPAAGLEVRDFAQSLAREGPPAGKPVLQGDRKSVV